MKHELQVCRGLLHNHLTRSLLFLRCLDVFGTEFYSNLVRYTPHFQFLSVFLNYYFLAISEAHIYFDPPKTQGEADPIL